MRIISEEEMNELLRTGKAKKVHLGSVKNVLKPRGPLQKESLSSYILERLKINYESWSDPTHSDNPDVGALLYYLKKNLDDEILVAWTEFLKEINLDNNVKESWDNFLGTPVIKGKAPWEENQTDNS